MKKIFSIFFVLAVISVLVLSVTGCAKKEATIVTGEPAAAPQQVAKPSQTTAKAMSDDVKALIAKADSKVTSFSYVHSEPPVDTEATTFYVKGTKIKAALFEPQEYENRVYFDTVYMDAVAKTAVAYCEHRDDTRCPDKNRQFSANYDTYFEKTPYMWVKEITFAEKIGEEQVDQKDVDVLQYTSGGKTVKLWVNQYYGLAQKVEVTEGGDTHTYMFSELDVNKLSDSDVTR
jgi:hypothetical protein